jgi:hypothetical protein
VARFFFTVSDRNQCFYFFLCVYKMAGGWMDDQCLDICKDGVFGSWVGELRKNANDLGTNLTAVEMEV